MTLQKTIRKILLGSVFTSALTVLGMPFVASNAVAQESSLKKAETLATFSADEMSNDKTSGIITAKGHVEVIQGDQTLLADVIRYNRNKDIISASGNVTLLRPNGDVLFARTMDVTGDLKNGMLKDFRAVLANHARFAAKQAKLVNNKTLTLSRAVYTACKPCRKHPSRPLLWELKAIKVVHDRTGHVIKYTDAWLEFAGVPVVYIPYLTHPDSSVKRKSGILTPRFGASSDLGFVTRIPYFQVIDAYSDITLTPIVTSKENGALAADYRRHFATGKIDFKGSAAYNSKHRVLGHIAARARFDINDTWRWGTDLNRASTDTYMRRYGFGNQGTLTSNVFAEGFRGDNYASISAMSFQGLRVSDNNETSPIVLPLVQYSYQGAPGKFGAYKTMGVNMAALTRSKTVDSQRLSIRPAWHLSYIAPKGDVYKLSAGLGVDLFHAINQPAPAAHGNAYNGAAFRIRPQVTLDWRWPFAKRHGGITEVIEPIAQATISPYGGNSYKMANEDSQDFDFSNANLFSANRFTGFDKVESGPRANYGLKWGVYGEHGGSTTAMLGQSYRLKKDDTFRQGSGLENHFSDYVGKVQMSPGTPLNLLYRTRIDKKTLTFRSNELGLNGRYGYLDYSTNFTFFARQAGSEYNGRKEINYNLGVQLTKSWKTSFAGVRDLTNSGGQRSLRWGFIYEDECFRFDATFNRRFYLDRDIKPADAIVFRLVFKTLGEFSTDVQGG